MRRRIIHFSAKLLVITLISYSDCKTGAAVSPKEEEERSERSEEEPKVVSRTKEARLVVRKSPVGPDSSGNIGQGWAGLGSSEIFNDLYFRRLQF